MNFGTQHLIGQSEIFLASIEKLPAISQTDSTALITGEPGTGKELCARIIHYLSRRAYRPFIPVNCPAMPGALFEARGGILFLDGIDALSLDAQAKLTSILDHRKDKPSEPAGADMRIICAASADLPKQISAGKIRSDLYERIQSMRIDLPPLRRRSGDIILLSQYFLQRYSPGNNHEAKCFSDDSMKKLTSYEWPGNVRELKNIVEKAISVSKGSVIQQDELDIHIGESMETPMRAIQKCEQQFLSYATAARKMISRFASQ
jgi:DNA-binding NtrC family response regulator